MPIITLTTEWKNNDYYLGTIKGNIYSKLKNITIVDISHQIQKYNILQAAFILKNCYFSYPPGTVHLICIKSEPTDEYYNIALLNQGHYFVGNDNGIFGLMFDNKPEKIVRISVQGNKKHDGIAYSTFPELTILTKAACHLAHGGDINNLREETEELVKVAPMLPTIEESTIVGSIIYIDSYMNAISNISNDLFTQIGKNRRFEIFIQSNYYKINKINKSYNETSDGELLVIFNSLGLLEIAIKNGNAAELLNLDTKSNIRIKFYDYQNS
ncbi:MAG: SAM-dependent chlorinase/fluorinase [Bacteroidia bacterium]|nr:SAM-dependent chlorinase/fluorinase [Bacteroidia bacterium]